MHDQAGRRRSGNLRELLAVILAGTAYAFNGKEAKELFDEALADLEANIKGKNRTDAR